MRRSRFTMPLLGLVVALLAAHPLAAQDVPDFSGRWVLDSAVPSSAEISRTMMVRQSLVRTNVRGEPMTPFFKDLTVTREVVGESRTETYPIGVVGGTVPGRAGLPRSHRRVLWQGQALVIESGTYTGRAPQSGEWTERREVWSAGPDGRLTITITTSGVSADATTTTFVYRRTPQGPRE